MNELLGLWAYECSGVPCTCTHDEDTNTFVIDSPDKRARGRWYADAVVPWQQGLEFKVTGDISYGALTYAVYLDEAGQFISEQSLAYDQPFTVLDAAAGMRIELRMGVISGHLTWENFNLELLTEIEEPEEPEEPEEVPTLPIPDVPPHDSHPVAGYKTGSNIFVTDVSGNPLPLPDDATYIVTGYQDGRRIVLDIGWPVEDITELFEYGGKVEVEQ